MKQVRGAKTAEPNLADKLACLQDGLQERAGEMQSDQEQLMELQPLQAKAVPVSDPAASSGGMTSAEFTGIPADERISCSQTGEGVGCDMDSREAGVRDAIVPGAESEEPASMPEGLVTDLRLQLANREAELEKVEGVLMQAQAALRQAQRVPQFYDIDPYVE